MTRPPERRNPRPGVSAQRSRWWAALQTLEYIGRDLAALPLGPCPGAERPMECLPTGRSTEPLRLASVLSLPEIGIAPGTLALALGGCGRHSTLYFLP